MPSELRRIFSRYSRASSSSVVAVLPAKNWSASMISRARSCSLVAVEICWASSRSGASSVKSLIFALKEFAIFSSVFCSP